MEMENGNYCVDPVFKRIRKFRKELVFWIDNKSCHVLKEDYESSRTT